MELFSEVYGRYYQLMDEILRRAPLSRAELHELVVRHGFGESVLFFEPRLLDGAWPLLEQRSDGRYYRRVEPTALPVTMLERSWLKALLADRRLALFLTPEERAYLTGALRETEALYRPEDFACFDQYLDGDPYEAAEYQAHFRTALAAVEQGQVLEVVFCSGRGERRQELFWPQRIEYSPQDDKFRLCGLCCVAGQWAQHSVINMARVQKIRAAAAAKPAGLPSPPERRELIVDVSRERDGVERFMLEFSMYERTSYYDASAQVCQVKLVYEPRDEREIVMRLLSFGPVVRVESPAIIRDEIQRRVKRQMELLAGDGCTKNGSGGMQ